MKQSGKHLNLSDSEWDTIIADMALGELEEGEKTHEMFAEWLGIKPTTARSRLCNLYLAGKVTKRHVIINGRVKVAYRPKKKTPA